MAVYLDSECGQWKLPQGISRLGRGADCEIRLDDLRLSRHHAQVILDGTSLQVSDLGSTNGILIDGDPVQGAITLSPGAVITIGPFRFTVRHAPDERDPSRIASEAVRSPKAPLSVASDEFSPSTDRSSRATMDMELRVETPVARPLTQPAPQRGGDDASPALTERRPSGRRLAPIIEEAILPDEQTVTPVPKTERKRETDALMPSMVGNRPSSEALLPMDEAGRPLLNSEQMLRLSPLVVEEPGRPQRLLAALGDGMVMLLTIAVCLGGGLIAAFAVAYGIDPDSALVGEQWRDHLLWWHHQGGNAWTLWFAIVAAATASTLVLLLWLGVARTTLHGAPPCHRLLSLVVIDQRSGHFPAPSKALLRALLLVITAPLALFLIVLGRTPLHDQIMGCRVQRWQPPAGI